MLNEQPEKAAPAVKRYVGGGRLPLAVVLAAIRSSKGNFLADPRKIVDGARRMRDFQAEIKTLKAKVRIGELFDTRFYEALGK